ncbi:SDR family NAD(P)-dependent oxidoreductase [Novosphingobium olei]|uniref:SDR family NAD(P)-dependent oxidoreductase n=1 Tax=Novosphingobium olei TaxID=2728851 RepID=A0A7Y0G930_9SPHN|nr:SDR family NAD(P)-dependent oxidoreductase [Novosphingobium olei]NML92227.1 SDR family NAD(P)-dependent oxidoreductase [Novosphingobium olei]
MAEIVNKTALIVGSGPGISASVARALAGQGYRLALAARNPDKLRDLAAETGAATFEVDASSPAAVSQLFKDAQDAIGLPEVVLYNAAGRLRGPLEALDPETVRRVLEVSAYGGFLVAQQAAKRLVPLARGAILLTGATASVKGFANSAAFAIGKFGLRGLAQSAARELAPKGVHVAHFVIDGAVRSAERPDPATAPDSTLDPDAIAQTYLAVLAQPRSAWTWEVELRPYVEVF